MSRVSGFLVAASLAALLCSGAALAQGAFSVDKTSIGELLDNPRTKAIFVKHLPQVAADPRLGTVLGMTLTEVAPLSEGVITDAKLKAIQADLAALDTPAPAGLTEGVDPAIAARMAAMNQPPAGFVPTPTPSYGDWPTWGYDPERTGWNRGETTLSKSNVGKLKIQWSTQLSVPVDKFVLSTMTAPVVISGVALPGGPRDVLFILGANSTLYALDATSGAKLWERAFANPYTSGKDQNWLCPNTPNDTPTIDRARGIVFFITGDGKLRGLNLADGAERLAPVDFVAPFARAWSLNLVGDVVYSTSGRACGEVMDKKSPMAAAALSGLRRAGSGPLLDASAIQAADVSDLAHPQVTRFYTSGARPAAPWGRGGAVRGPQGSMILETSDGKYDPAAGDFSESILKVSPQAARLVDSYTPANWQDNLQHDMSGSASPVVFDFAGKTIVAASQKESVLRLLDANNLGGASHKTPLWQSPKLGNDEKTGTDPSRGVWGGIATYETGGRRFLYLPLYGHPSKDSPVFPVTNGETPNGRIMAFEVVNKAGAVSAVPVWTSTDMIMPDPPVVANGVVYALSTGGQAMQNGAKPGDPRMAYPVSAVLRSTPVDNLKLYAYDAVTGKQLYASKTLLTDWVHFSEPVVALGKVYVVTHDAKVFAFGVK